MAGEEYSTVVGHVEEFVGVAGYAVDELESEGSGGGDGEVVKGELSGGIGQYL